MAQGSKKIFEKNRKWTTVTPKVSLSKNVFIDLLMSTELKSDDVQKDEKEKILNNLAECLLRLERWREAENRATEVLQSSPNNEKALWRRGKARCQLLEVS